MTDKQVFKQRFKENYKGKRLLAIQLDGFSHKVIYDEKEKGAPVSGVKVDYYSGCMGQTEAESYGYNSAAAIKMFEGYPNYSYQNNAKEIVYVKP